jgi:hypothetical protein
LLEALRDLIADQEIMGGALLLRKLKIGKAGAQQDRNTAERLPGRLAIGVLDINAGLCVANF